jgi:hypothetical protein
MAHLRVTHIGRANGSSMDRSALPSADRSTVWLADLIEETEVVTALPNHAILPS